MPPATQATPGINSTTSLTEALPIKPPPTLIPEVNFAMIGDYGDTNSSLPEVAMLIKSWKPDFIITSGDNNYPDGSAETIDANVGQYFHEYIFPYIGEYGPGGKSNRFFPVLGNHDWHAENAQPYIDYFELPHNERYYDLQWKYVHFFMIDNDRREPDGNEKESVQAKWLRKQLAASTSRWNIIVMHHPPYSSGERDANLELRWPFKEWGADIVLTGHDHFYERLMIDDFPYLINGLGGRGSYEFGEINSGSQKQFRDENGAILVKATFNSMIFKFITIYGEEIDVYKLSK